LPRLVATTPAGHRVELGIVRDGEAMTLDAVIVGRDTNQQVAANAGAHGPADQGRLGLALAPVNEETRRQFGLAKGAAGVLVTGVDPSGPAAEQGLRPGDLIVQVAHEKVSDPAEVSTLVEKAVAEKRETVLLLVERGGETRFVAIPVGKA
jgi:serine protease Do